MNSLPLRVLVVAGARPNFVKVSPLMSALRARRHAAVLVHTGQHYDAALSDSFFHELQIPAPDYHLNVGSGTHAVQTAAIMTAFEPVLRKVKPDWVVVVGDVNSTLAVALVTAKLRHELGCRLAHVEAGLRSGDWRMPEEVNRVMTDRLSDLLLIPTRDALPNLLREGIDPGDVVFVGNVMIDTLLARIDSARALNVPARHGLTRGRYALATIHRPSNVDDPSALRCVVDALAAVAGELPVLLPIHPRTRARLESAGRELPPGLIATEPLGYLEMLAAMDGAAVVLTDSGGVQEETTVLGVPCVTLRESTERPITIEEGTNRLAPFPITAGGLVAVLHAAMIEPRAAIGERAPEGWDGHASARVVAALEWSGHAQEASALWPMPAEAMLT